MPRIKLERTRKPTVRCLYQLILVATRRQPQLWQAKMNFTCYTCRLEISRTAQGKVMKTQLHSSDSLWFRKVHSAELPLLLTDRANSRLWVWTNPSISLISSTTLPCLYFNNLNSTASLHDKTWGCDVSWWPFSMCHLYSQPLYSRLPRTSPPYRCRYRVVSQVRSLPVRSSQSLI